MNCCGWPFLADVSSVESIVLILGRPQIIKFKPLIKHLFAQFPQGFQARRFQCFKLSGWLHKNTGHQRDFQHPQTLRDIIFVAKTEQKSYKLPVD